MLSVALWIVIGLVIYCLTCWVVGFTLVFLGKVHDDLIPGATIYAPLMPIAFLSIFVQDRIAFNLTERRYERKAKWIAEELQKKGIKLHRFGVEDDVNYYGYNSLHKSCEVQVADLKQEQVEAYREVYARTIKKFGWRFTPGELCGGAYPQWPLSREWARSIEINEYFAEHFISCIYCQNKRSMGWHWGNYSFHIKPCDCNLGRTYHCPDGNVKTFPGWLCQDCKVLHVGLWEWEKESLPGN